MKKLEFFMVLALVLAVLALTPSSLQAAWVGNDLEGSGGEKSSQTEGFIIDGASYFLQSYADILLILNESEIGLKNGIHGERVFQLVETARDKLETAIKQYSLALALIKKTVFSETWLQTLKTFDYEGLAAARHLHPDVMQQVSAFLSNCDVVGLYQRLLDNMKKLQTQLQEMAKNAPNGILPGMEQLRTLYQLYSDSMLLGYYTSLALSTIKSL